MNEIAETREVSQPIDSDLLLRLARECIALGPGYAQDMVVLRMAAERLGVGADLERQQRLLTAWHDLFRSGQLAWGYDVDNPTAPFFHLPRRNGNGRS
jgi:hypothetical protein